MFGFTRSQRNGLLVLAALIVLSLFAPYFFELFKKAPEDYADAFAQFEQEIEAARIKTQKPTKDIQRFQFNPNTTTKKDFERLGLNPKQVAQILNYRTKGGQFRTKSDFAKIYAVDDSTYALLEDYIILPAYQKKTKRQYAQKSWKKDSIKQSTFKSKSEPGPEPKIVRLNTASESELQAIRGIGPAFSKRIVKYRKALGGFIKIEQLLEVYGLKQETLDLIQPYLELDISKLEKLKINFISASDLFKHPYFDKALAKKIMKVRSFKGSYKDLQDFSDKLQLDEVFIRKVEAYLQF